MDSLTGRAVAVLRTADPAAKVAATLAAARDWKDGTLTAIGAERPPLRPARPARPVILPPNKMPRRGTGAQAGRIAMFHALAHIEFNAIDLGWDIIARFADPALPKAFYDDWVMVAEQEAEHFTALEALMAEMGAAYGDLPAHDGLWQAAEKTADSLERRLAVVPMTLEARALDTAPHTVGKLGLAAEDASQIALRKIVDEEILHVAAGTRWFNFVCAHTGLDPAARYQAIVREAFPKGLKRPFNTEGRSAAGLPAHYYEPLGV